MDCFVQVVWRPDADARVMGGRGVEFRPELVQDSCRCRVASDYGEVYELPMCREADWAGSRAEDLLVPREAASLVLRRLVRTEQRRCNKVVSGLPDEGVEDCWPRCATQGSPLQAALEVAAALRVSEEAGGAAVAANDKSSPVEPAATPADSHVYTFKCRRSRASAAPKRDIATAFSNTAVAYEIASDVLPEPDAGRRDDAERDGWRRGQRLARLQGHPGRAVRQPARHGQAIAAPAQQEPIHLVPEREHAGHASESEAPIAHEAVFKRATVDDFAKCHADGHDNVWRRWTALVY